MGEGAQRFVALEFGYPSPALEERIVAAEAGVDAATAEQVEVEVAGNNSWGSHVTAKVRVQLPNN